VHDKRCATARGRELQAIVDEDLGSYNVLFAYLDGSTAAHS